MWFTKCVGTNQHHKCRKCLQKAGKTNKPNRQQSTLLRVLTDGLGVEVECFCVFLLDIVCISLLFEAFSFPTESTHKQKWKWASRNRRSDQLLDNLVRFSSSKTEHPLCTLGHGYGRSPQKNQTIQIRKHCWHMHITFQRREATKETDALSGLKHQNTCPHRCNKYSNTQS